MNFIIFYLAFGLLGFAVGKLQHAALSKNKPLLLAITLCLRLTLLILAGLLIPLLQLSLLHFILSIILFWICSFMTM